MLDLSLNKQSYSGTDQNTAWEDRDGSDNPNKTSYFGFRVQSATKRADELSMHSSANRIPVSQTGHRIQDTICSEQAQGPISASPQYREVAPDTFGFPKSLKMGDYCQSQNSQRSNKTNATSTNNGARRIQKQESSATSSQMSKKDGSSIVSSAFKKPFNQKTQKPQALQNLMVIPKRAINVATDERTISQKQEYAMQCLQDTKISGPPEAIPLVNEDEQDGLEEFRDLFIQGTALNADQIEAMDLNLLEMSLQNQVDDNSVNDEQDLKRLESFSPQMDYLNEQNFKLQNNTQASIAQMRKSSKQEFNFTFNQSENPMKNVTKNIGKKKNNLMKKVQLFSPQQKSQRLETNGAQQIQFSCRNSKLNNCEQAVSEIAGFQPHDNVMRMQSQNYELDMYNLLQGHTIALNKQKPQTCQNSATKQFSRFKPMGDLLEVEKQMHEQPAFKLPTINKQSAMVHLPSIFSPSRKVEQHPDHSLFSDGNLSNYQPQSRRLGTRGNRNIPQNIHHNSSTTHSYLEVPRQQPRYAVEELSVNLSTDPNESGYSLRPPFPKQAHKYGHHKKSIHSVLPPDANFLEESFSNMSPLKQGIVHKRDIKSSSRLPQAFRIYRSNQHKNRLNNSHYHQ